MPLSPNADFFLAVAEETRDSLSDSAFTGEFEKCQPLPEIRDKMAVARAH